jgi:hypothetical protein
MASISETLWASKRGSGLLCHLFVFFEKLAVSLGFVRIEGISKTIWLAVIALPRRDCDSGIHFIFASLSVSMLLLLRVS